MTTSLVGTIAAAIASVAGPKAALHEPEIAGNEWRYVKECLDTEWVSSAGAYVDRFESQLAEFTGSGHAVATVNGTAALHTCLMLAGVRPGDEVIVPALTFVATANAVAHAGAAPHLADVEERTLGLDAGRLARHLAAETRTSSGACVNRRTGRRIAAVVAVHTFGHACELEALAETCARFALPLIEDAAESLGSYYQGRHTGTFGRLAALSFNGNKIVTTGGGGAVLTQDADLAAAARHLTTTAKVPHAWEFVHDRVGYNYRLPNLNAALGCAQMEQLPGFLAEKRVLAERYRAAFAPIEGVSFFAEPEGRRSNYWLNVVLLDRGHSRLRDEILAATNATGLTTRPAWAPMHRLPMYADCPRMDLAQAEDIHARLINLPSSPRLARSKA